MEALLLLLLLAVGLLALRYCYLAIPPPFHHYGSMFSAHPLLERGPTPFRDGLQPHMEIGRRPSSSSGSVCPAGRRPTTP